MKTQISNLVKVTLLTLIVLFSNCKTEKKTQMIADTIVTEEKPKEELIRRPVAFITGVDGKKESFYADARTYFENQDFEIVEGQYSLEEIINWMNKNHNNLKFGEVHIVNKSNPFQGMTLETTIHGKKVTELNLDEKLANQQIPILGNVISDKTKIVLHANGIANNEFLVDNLKTVFTAEKSPKVIASKYITIFNSEFSEHHLAKPYYVFYPTAKSPGKTDLSKEIARKYKYEKEIDWFAALNNKKERFVGEPYSEQFNIPVKFELDYTNSDNEIPVLKTKKDIINFVLQDQYLASKIAAYNIPLDKFRWNSIIGRNKLTIKGIVTVICVLKPIIKPYGDLQHVEPNIDNERLYATN